jgi:hypothetical protein
MIPRQFGPIIRTFCARGLLDRLAKRTLAVTKYCAGDAKSARVRDNVWNGGRRRRNYYQVESQWQRREIRVGVETVDRSTLRIDDNDLVGKTRVGQVTQNLGSQ